MENVKDHLENIRVYLDELDSKNKLIYECFNELSTNIDVNIDNFDNTVSNTCIDYLRKINDVQGGELVNNERVLNLKCHYDVFVKFQSELRNIMDRYSDIFTLDNGLVPTICYNDHIQSNKLNLSLINRYCGSYYYNEYYSDRRTYDGDIYIDHDGKNEDLIVKYMNDENELIDDINNMDFDERSKFLQDLDFFNLPIKTQYLNISGFNGDSRIMESWRKRKMVMIDDEYFEGISKRLRKSGKIEEMYNDKLLKDIIYDDENNYFGIAVKMKYSDIIENYLKNDRKLVDKTLILKGLKIEDIINEMNKFGINLNDDERSELEETWMSMRYIFVNDSYKQFIDGYLKKEHKFIDLYLNNMSNEEIDKANHFLFVNININNADMIEKYLNNDKEWRKDDLFIRKLKYSEILSDLNIIGLITNEDDKNKLKLEWMKLRRVWVNNDYKQSIDRYLKSNDKFIDIYENNISNEIYDAYDDILYVNIELKYEQAIIDYITHDKHLNIELVRHSKNYKYDEFNKELQLLDIELSDNEIIKLKLSIFSFSSISKILNKKYDNYLSEWLGNEYEWKCIYRASEHGYTTESFHEYCDDVGPTLIVIKNYKGWFSGGGYIFGGYTTKSWKGYNEYKVDNDAFIFTLYNAHGVLPTRYAALRDSGGIACASYWGPIFSVKLYSDICISINGKNCNTDNSCYINNNGTFGYECDPKYKKSLFVNTAGPSEVNYFSVSDYEVFAINFKDIDMVMKVTGYSLEIKGLEIVEKPLTNPSLVLNGTSIVDEKYDKYLNEWLGTEYKWKLIYRASEYGYRGESFHRYCDNVGPTLIIIKSHNGYIFGGYTTQSWNVLNPDARGFKLKTDKDAFIFTLYNAHGILPTRYNALKDIGGISCHAGRGPSFTDNQNTIDIFLNYGGKNCNEMDSCVIYNNGSNGYECDPIYKSSLFVNTNGPDYTNLFSISDYEVFAHK